MKSHVGFCLYYLQHSLQLKELQLIIRYQRECLPQYNLNLINP